MSSGHSVFIHGFPIAGDRVGTAGPAGVPDPSFRVHGSANHRRYRQILASSCELGQLSRAVDCQSVTNWRSQSHARGWRNRNHSRPDCRLQTENRGLDRIRLAVGHHRKSAVLLRLLRYRATRLRAVVGSASPCPIEQRLCMMWRFAILFIQRWGSADWPKPQKGIE